jgi:transcriptional regulator of acetoin/glycerol metabolism
MPDLKIVWFLQVSGSQRKFFRQKFDLSMQFGCRVQKLMHYSGVNGNKTKAAEIPGIDRVSIGRKMKRCGLQ